MKRAYQPIEFEATLCPIRRPLEVLDRQDGRINELFGAYCFGNALVDPQSIPIVIDHHNEPATVGHLVRISPGSDWLLGRFWLFDSLVGLYAAEQLDANDGAVSIEFTPRRALDRVGELETTWHTDARLDAVAIVTLAYQSAFPGAKVVRMLDRVHESREPLPGAPPGSSGEGRLSPDDPGWPPVPASALEPGLRIRHGLGRITGIK